jgi:hypothetical protein
MSEAAHHHLATETDILGDSSGRTGPSGLAPEGCGPGHIAFGLKVQAARRPVPPYRSFVRADSAPAATRFISAHTAQAHTTRLSQCELTAVTV